MIGPARFARAISLALAGAMIIPLAGCTSFKDYVHNGFKVGPNYAPPPARVAPRWIDQDLIRTCPGEDLSKWWTVFRDPTLNRLIACAYHQNLTLREAGFRVLEARAQLGIVRGDIFPQQQDIFGSYRRQALSVANVGQPPANRFFDQWNFGFNLAWEIDVWGRFRRAITAAEDQLDASVAGYDDVLVTLLGDVASNYVQARTLQKRIYWLKRNADAQRWVVDLIRDRVQAGRGTDVDFHQASSIFHQTVAQIPETEIQLRQAENRLCILLGMPPVDIQRMLGAADIPRAPPDVVIGIPADLLRRRPDVRRAERLAAAQAEQIGIAQAEFYPAISINGTLGWQAQKVSDLFTSRALAGNFGPSFQWNVLNYGRILNNVKLQEARFLELVVTYQQTVLQADEEVENGLVTFLKAQKRTAELDAAAADSMAIVEYWRQGFPKLAAFDVNRYSVIIQNLVQQQDLLAQAQGEIAQGLIQVYRAMGGGWEIRCFPPPVPPAPGAGPMLRQVPEEVPPPPGAPVPPPPSPPAPPPPVKERAAPPDVPTPLPPVAQDPQTSPPAVSLEWRPQGA